MTKTTDTPVITHSIIDDIDALGKSQTTADLVSESTDQSHLPSLCWSVDAGPDPPEPDTTFKQPC